MPEIISVDDRSPAFKAKLKAGDILISVNGHVIHDVFDYKFYAYDRDPVFELGDGRRVKLKKSEGMDPGLNFKTYLMDSQKRCANNCIFCFIDQLPGGMRQSLYFKDDDARMSFLLGNYVSLTNLSDEDADRIVKMRISPVNVSVHTTNPELRVRMLRNPRGGESLKYLRAFLDAGLTVNCQIVLCPGLNDGDELDRTISDLCSWKAESVAVVPVGITRYRDGLYPLEPVSPECAGKTLDIIEKYRGGFTDVCGSDELFLRAGRPIPPEEYYGAFSQLENGVGLMAMTESDFTAGLSCENGGCPEPCTVVTGKAAEKFISGLLEKIRGKYPDFKFKVIGVKNRFFGETVDVAGLLTGQDIAFSAKGNIMGRFILPDITLKNGETVFLDDMTLAELEKEVGCSVILADTSGTGLLSAVFGK